MLKNLFIFFLLSGLTACGSPLHTSQTGVEASQHIILVGNNLTGNTISIGSIRNHEIKAADLTKHDLTIATSANSELQNKEILEIKVNSGNNLIIIKDKNGKIILKKSIYLSNGQTSTVKL